MGITALSIAFIGWAMILLACAWTNSRDQQAPVT
jgi:hypothetical protein